MEERSTLTTKMKTMAKAPLKAAKSLKNVMMLRSGSKKKSFALDPPEVFEKPRRRRPSSAPTVPLDDEEEKETSEQGSVPSSTNVLRSFTSTAVAAGISRNAKKRELVIEDHLIVDIESTSYAIFIFLLVCWLRIWLSFLASLVCSIVLACGLRSFAESIDQRRELTAKYVAVALDEDEDRLKSVRSPLIPADDHPLAGEADVQRPSITSSFASEDDPLNALQELHLSRSDTPEAVIKSCRTSL
jgi:hypothetical protein